jgi:hypothetical protein
MGASVLLITNGDSAAGRITRSGVPGEVLPWRDVLHEGPVPSGLPLDELREVRARFIAEQGWGDLDEVTADLVHRDSVLAGFRDHEEVVLLFEHDLYDQLQLIQLLDWFGRRNLGATRLSLACVNEYLGTLEPDRMHTLVRNRREVSGQELELGRAACEAFRSSDPTRISALLREDTSALPFLEDALLRHLEQFPSTKNGLSRSERQALEAISDGHSMLREVFVASHQEREDIIFLADTVFASYLESLSRVSEPLVLLENGDTISPPRGSAAPSDFWGGKVILTEIGREVLEGKKDRVATNGFDRWLGGVHPSGSEARWRWDEFSRQLIRSAA